MFGQTRCPDCNVLLVDLTETGGVQKLFAVGEALRSERLTARSNRFVVIGIVLGFVFGAVMVALIPFFTRYALVAPFGLAALGALVGARAVAWRKSGALVKSAARDKSQ